MGYRAVTTPDFTVDDHGSIAVLTPHTPAAHAWQADNLAHEEAQYWNGGIVIEPRYLDRIIEGAEEDGLVVA